MREVEQKELRGDGKIRSLEINAENLAEATRSAIIACHDNGFRVETPKQTRGMTLGYDADIKVRVENPDSEPKIYTFGMSEDGRGLMQYILEVTHGIHNHWLKDEEHPTRWGYTYNGRFADQIPFILQRIKKDWDKKRRISGRDYQFATWVAGKDIVPEEEDPPCFQLGQFRFVDDFQGNIVMNYQTEWRSRDLLKAWNENNIAQIELMKLFAAKVSSVIGEPIKLGAYVDRSTSLHLYGLYLDKFGLEESIANMKKAPYTENSMTLADYLTLPPDMDAIPWPGTIEAQKRLIASQSDYEAKTGSLNASRKTLADNGYDLDNFPYPSDWDSWPKEWDAEPGRSKLARII
ncbi:MAG TPA: hypothetical protein VMC07_00790 [Candidatus Omnitrophota bacterium]|nr:hypothetical protein [Candidatus Omnitrophota bacterium]